MGVVFAGSQAPRTPASLALTRTQAMRDLSSQVSFPAQFSTRPPPPSVLYGSVSACEHCGHRPVDGNAWQVASLACRNARNPWTCGPRAIADGGSAGYPRAKALGNRVPRPLLFFAFSVVALSAAGGAP